MTRPGGGPTGQWVYFKMMEYRKAQEWADKGGIAVHESGRIYRGQRTAHLLAQKKSVLISAARKVGVPKEHIQARKYFVHFDLFGKPLRQAMQFCGINIGLSRKEEG